MKNVLLFIFMNFLFILALYLLFVCLWILENYFLYIAFSIGIILLIKYKIAQND